VGLIHIDVRREKGNNERHGNDDAVPESLEEAGVPQFVIGNVEVGIPSRGAGKKQADADEAYNEFHVFSPCSGLMYVQSIPAPWCCQLRFFFIGLVRDREEREDHEGREEKKKQKEG
jgi:hypothetical protein